MKAAEVDGEEREHEESHGHENGRADDGSGSVLAEELLDECPVARSSAYDVHGRPYDRPHDRRVSDDQAREPKAPHEVGRGPPGNPRDAESEGECQGIRPR